MGNSCVFSRECHVANDSGDISDLKISFYIPKFNDEYNCYEATVDLECSYFSRTLRATGEDEAQAFFWLPKVVAAYLIGQRRDGYEAYWFEKGDLDEGAFWGFTRSSL